MPFTLKLALAACMFLSVAVFAACGNSDDSAAPPSAGDWPAFFSLADLVQASDAIVVATLLDERVEEVDVQSDDPPGGRDAVTEVLRTFAVEDALSGALQNGDVFITFSTANTAHYPAGGGAPQEIVFQVLRMELGERYLLFLSMVVLPEYYPDEWGVIAWAAPGEPHAARVDAGGQLRWITTGRYDAARELRNIQPAPSGAGPGFDATVETVRSLVEHLHGDDAPAGGGQSPD